MAFSSFPLRGELAPSLHFRVEHDGLIAAAFTRFLVDFEAKKYTWLEPDDPRQGIYPVERQQQKQPESVTVEFEAEVDPDQLHPGLAVEDEQNAELGLHMSPRRGEDEEADGSDNEEALETGGSDDEAQEAAPQRRKKWQPRPKPIKATETYVYAHAGGRSVLEPNHFA